MGDRIVIRLTDGEKWSPDLYCHSAGMDALWAVIKAVKESKPDGDPQQMMCNVVLEAMKRTPQEYGFYLESHGEVKHGDLDNGEWEYNTATGMWKHIHSRWERDNISGEWYKEGEVEHMNTTGVIMRLEGDDEE